ncbi:MAG: hypothetical protein IBJ04_02090 [Hydrogenophaga sp.]|uniref:Uncharacterized protein n=1 Tax=Hydrogenophaga crocea TaxID=2716225 RepID=A0A6G8IND7_9BURK|nr:MULTISPECIES: hypothetical protein [Hydrogenophaga]MBL0943106.1 hypothetical protein [Hydrogenophaga sp.]QIM54490.1 hypothetical protein G9Q37_21130 [Hydrogenophaga crocea]
MTFGLLLGHVLAFVAPAFGLALVLWLGLRVRRAQRFGPATQFAVLLAAGVLVLVAGLVLFDRDGRMAVYAALVGVQGTLAWWLRGR